MARNLSNLLVANPTSNVLPHNYCDPCQTIFERVARYPVWPGNQVTQPIPGQYAFPRLDVPQQPDNPAILVNFHNIQTLISSASEGCHLCKLIVTELDPKATTELLDQLVTTPEAAWDQLKVLVWRFDHELIVRLQQARPAPGTANERAFLNLRYKDVTQIPEYRTTFATSSSSTASFETFNKIHHWLWECNSSHVGCLQIRLQRQFTPPARLIHVGKFASESIVRLVESRNLPSNTLERRYITLSHCWGSTVQFKLTSSRYDEFLSGLTLEALPKTFRDAITLTRYLGMDYIWIDCLCIIQDSRSDWERESYRMSDIYSGSFLNIGANAYGNSSGGLFQERDPYTVTPLRKILQWPPGRGSDRAVAFFPVTSANTHIERGPLSKRAWVAQERLLAPRTLHFTKHKVCWECPTLAATETDVTGHLDGPSLGIPHHWTSLPEGLNTPQLRGDACLDQWALALQMYTKGELSYQTDKLVAISGLANRLQAMWNDTSVRYLAGLWSYDLEMSLLWHVSSEDRGNCSPADPTAPSWSWAAVRGLIFAHRPRNLLRSTTRSNNAEDSERLLSAVLESQTTLTGNPFGPVQGGFVRIRGPLCEVLATTDQTGKHNVLKLNNTQLKFRSLSPDGTSLIPPPTQSHSNALVLLGIYERASDEVSLRGLVLRATGATRGEYVRVGHWESSYIDMERENNRKVYEIYGEPVPSPNEEGKDFRLIKEAFDKMSLRTEAFEQVHQGSKVYTIKIV